MNLFKIVVFSIEAFALSLADDCSYYESTIVGGGPSSLQMGYLMKWNKNDFIIVERESTVASLYSKMPIHGSLLSINKKYTGVNKKYIEYQMRHDWNSLIIHNNDSDEENLYFTEYSDDYYPHKDDLYRYFNDFSEKYQINQHIQFNSNVRNIKKMDNLLFKIEYVVEKGMCVAPNTWSDGLFIDK